MCAPWQVTADAIFARDYAWVMEQSELREALLHAHLLLPAPAPLPGPGEVPEGSDGAEAPAAFAPSTAPSTARAAAEGTDGETEGDGTPRAVERATSSSYLSAPPSASEGSARPVSASTMGINASLLREGGEALTRAQSDFLNREGHSANTTDSDFLRAHRLFIGAYALFPRPTTLLSAANMASKVGECALALELYTRVLEGTTILKPEHAKLATKRAAEASEMLTSFEVSSPGGTATDSRLLA